MSDELKTRPNDPRPAYEAPRAVRMDGRTKGQGADCEPGSGATDWCDPSGNSASSCRYGQDSLFDCVAGAGGSGFG